MAKNTPRTTQFFGEELIPWLVDTIGLLIDDDSILEDSDGCMKEGVVTADVGKNGYINVYVRLPRAAAARVIGKNHITEEALWVIFRAILKNHNFDLGRLVVRGDEEELLALEPEQIIISHKTRRH